jgi:hypothetical protein
MRIRFRFLGRGMEGCDGRELGLGGSYCRLDLLEGWLQCGMEGTTGMAWYGMTSETFERNPTVFGPHRLMHICHRGAMKQAM